MSEASRKLQFRRHPHLHKASVTYVIQHYRQNKSSSGKVDNHYLLNLATCWPQNIKWLFDDLTEHWYFPGPLSAGGEGRLAVGLGDEGGPPGVHVPRAADTQHQQMSASGVWNTLTSETWHQHNGQNKQTFHIMEVNIILDSLSS